MSLRWIDSHTHLEHEYPFSTEEYLKSARQAGICGFVTIGTVPGTYDKLQTFAESQPDVFFTVGVHPHESKDYTDEVEAELEQFQKHPKCVGIGEIGLDYYYDHSKPDEQKQAFLRQRELALRVGKPIVIHARDAEDDLLAGLHDYAAKCKLAQGPGIIHCFSGTRNFAKECLKLGFYISFSGILTFKTAADLRFIAQEVPLDRVLLETDSPFLAPVPHRGKANQSAYMVETAKVLAAAKGVTLEALSDATVANTRKIFRLP